MTILNLVTSTLVGAYHKNINNFFFKLYLSQERVGSGIPVAKQINWTVLPTSTARSTGGKVIVGGTGRGGEG